LKQEALQQQALGVSCSVAEWIRRSNQLAPRDAPIQIRGHTLKLQKSRYRTHKRWKFFDARVVDKWNSLPDSIMCSPCTSMTTMREMNREEAPCEYLAP